MLIQNLQPCWWLVVQKLVGKEIVIKFSQFGFELGCPFSTSAGALAIESSRSSSCNLNLSCKPKKSQNIYCFMSQKQFKCLLCRKNLMYSNLFFLVSLYYNKFFEKSKEKFTPKISTYLLFIHISDAFFE